MRSTVLRSILLAGILLIFTNQSFSQWRTSTSGSLTGALFSNLAPSLPGGQNVFSPDMSSILVSGFVGFNHNTNIGNFSAKCDCSFEGKVGLLKIGLAFGGDITYIFSSEWGVIAKLYYDDKHTTESFERSKPFPIKYGNQVIIRDVKTEEKANVSLSYLTAGLFMRYQPRLQRWFVYAGPTIGKNLSNKIEQTETIVTNELTYIEGANTERIVSQDGIDNRNNIRAEALVGVGYEYMLGPRLFLSPEFQFAYPITKITSGASTSAPDGNWKVATARLSVGLKYVAF